MAFLNGIFTGSFLGLLWDFFCFFLRSLRDSYGIIFGTFTGSFLGLLWDFLRSLRDSYVLFTGRSRIVYEIVLRFLRDRFKTVLGSLRDSYGHRCGILKRVPYRIFFRTDTGFFLLTDRFGNVYEIVLGSLQDRFKTVYKDYFSYPLRYFYRILWGLLRDFFLMVLRIFLGLF